MRQLIQLLVSEKGTVQRLSHFMATGTVETLERSLAESEARNAQLKKILVSIFEKRYAASRLLLHFLDKLAL